MLKAHGTQLLKVRYNKLLESVGFYFNLRPSTEAHLGLVIRPEAFNKIIREASHVTKAAIYTVLGPALLVVDGLCRAKLDL
jgi:hypothetical protein